MTSRDDMAGLVAELRTQERVLRYSNNFYSADLMKQSADALDSLTSRSMEAGGGGNKLASDKIRLVIESLKLLEAESQTASWQRADDPSVDLSDEISQLGDALRALSPVPGEGVTDEMVERAAAKLPLGCVKGPSHLESRLGERRKLARAALTAALSPPVKGKE